ncbi:ABC transporter permease [Nocardioides caldifontis]|uniref:ABC transporter permease n=1 Tax=Nocardioides caldifontis TaxID=2588938 RepID=UPI0011DFE221|nr:ABC transporter permease [Nocardioides caldifontis]
MVAPVAVVGALFIVYPLVKLTMDAFTQGDGGFSNFAAVFESAAIRNSLVNTIVMSLVVTVLCVVMGASISWSIARARSAAFKALLWAALLLPFWMGVVVKAYAWSIIFAKNGILNSVLDQAGVIDEPMTLLYTRLAVVVGMTYTMLPYAVLAMNPTMSRFEPEFLNSARSLGSSRTAAMVRVWLPIVAPGLIAAAAIVFAISIGFYVTPVLLGGAETPFMATMIGDDIFAFFNYPRAAASSVLLLVLALVVLGTALKAVGSKALKGGIAG